jgi:UDP-N-acetylglucosamine--N-acetylmuramyl-(pentapeptide) pyrophosphoryl-undecaprenol N-acetylglucosamine transferase
VNRPLQKPILVMAGGTGGHVFPALAVAENLRQRGESVVWLGTRSGIEARVVPAAGFAIEWLSIQGLRGKGALSLLLAPLRLLRACWQALGVLRRNRPKAVLGMGGFVAGPGGLMAWLLDIPLFVHEQNSVIGLTNRILSRLATRSYFAFPETAAAVARGECIGNPVRANLEDMGDPAARLEARAGQPMQLLVVGGSLGAAALNRIVPAAVACLDREQRPSIRHQCGERHLEDCEQHYREARVDAEVVRFIDDMREAYAWADLVICRAGALTIAELTAAGVASILVPFPHAVDDHQYYNALYLERQQAAQIIREADLEARELALKIQYFRQNRPALVAMAERARACFQADATERLVDGILAGARS